MFINYLKIAFRSLLKFKGYAAINLLGLALGLAAGIMIMIYVADELSFDTFHKKSGRIYRVETRFFANKSAADERANDANGWPVGNILRNEFPEVEAVLYTRNASSFAINHEGKRFQQKLHFASPEFFDIFSFNLKKGNPGTALTEPYSVVITEEMEEKYFRGGDAVNQTLVLGDSLPFVVTGVMQNIPSNSHIQLDMLVSFATYAVLDSDFSYDTGWGNINIRNYVLLREGADFNAIAAKAKNIYTERAGQMLKDWGVQAEVLFAPLEGLYLTTRSGNGMGPVGSMDRIYLVSGIACFVIVLACINFINLTTARSVYRAREVGLRKVVGSSRQGLVRQFLSESFVLTILSLFVAIALTGMLLPLFNQLLGKSYSMNALLQPASVAGTALLVILVTLLSGYYPALVLSGLRPVDVLKGKMQSSPRGVQLRRGLVIFQFVISVGLVLGTLVILDQLRFMQQQDLGFAGDQVFVVNAARARPPDANGFEAFRNDIRDLAMTENVTLTNSLPGHPGWIGQVAYPEGRSGDAAISVEYMAVDEDYIHTLGIQLIAGRGFDRDHMTELEGGLILNETAVNMFGWTSPEEAIGKRITSPSSHPAGEVIGVVKDYHQLGLQQKIGPMTMDFNPDRGYMYAIRYKAADTRVLITSMEELWKKHFPGYDFNYFFLDSDFEKQYQAERSLANVFALFAGITIFIAVTGLLGLVSFMVASRTKEIGVRKVLGANVVHITALLSREFITLVVIANMITFPVAWYFAEQWLQNFENRVGVNPFLFVLALAIALAVTLLTIGFQTLRAAMTDPVRSLRYE